MCDAERCGRSLQGEKKTFVMFVSVVDCEQTEVKRDFQDVRMSFSKNEPRSFRLFLSSLV